MSDIIKKFLKRKMSDAKDLFDEALNSKTCWCYLRGTEHQKKLDPVGKEDGDIDNDGDEDDTDSYLLNRRKAIGKAMKLKRICKTGKEGKKKKDEKT